ncbi:hypothetical protein [Glutamicibacter mysorens]|uniref:hypothetical protein n=1 Tax=Glutamicibacter mysorens TaxID=257984 RepID=UPI0020C6E8EA|nr:hypothetical protein [Glutamicibacter mysorens]UTM47399.1 hypothetical protein XH9_00795 [Glutamicibacter mysorens]
MVGIESRTGAAQQGGPAPVLVAAWERGLTDLIVVPWAGYCMHRLGDSHLATSFETAANWSLLRQALAEWIRAPLK